MRRNQFVGVLLAAVLFAPITWAQAAPKSSRAKKKPETAPPGISMVTAVSVVQERGASAVEILSTLPSVPSIQFLDSPPRLVIDLLHAQVQLKDKPNYTAQENILAVRAEQFQADPPIARVVLDLKAPFGYTWDEEGNRLMVRLKPAEEVAGKRARSRANTGAGLAASATVAAVSPNEVSLDESKIAPGSSLTSGADTAVLHLERGGEVRICPQSTVSVTPSKSSHDLMLGMNTGALETHYVLQSSADTVMTPDFRIMLAGPGKFDFAISANAHGDTCVRGLKGNSSSAIVSELMGDRIYQVKPGEQAVFRGGRIDKVDNNVPLECGCPSSPAVMRTEVGAAPTGESAANSSAAPNQAPPSSPKPEAGTPGNLAAGDKDLPPLSNGPEIRPLPPSDPNAVHVQVEAPMVFHAKKETSAPPAEDAQTSPGVQTKITPVQPESQVVVSPPPVQPPTPAPPQKSTENPSAPRRMMRRIKGFFSSIFH